MATQYKLKIDMPGGDKVDVNFNVTDSTITFTEMPTEMAAEDYDAINAFLAACTKLMRNPRMLKAEVEREG